VLPFANLSGDPGRQYFADGMAEELRTALARINRLKVIGRTSSESVRDVEARKAAARLGVAYVLLGSIRQSPTTIRVTAQLVDGSDGVALWSETYDRGPGDILAIQSDIARSVAQALVPRLAPDEQAALAAGSTSSAAAHDLMLKALALDASSDSEEAQRRAVGYMDAAIALDPQYADAHAMRSLRLAQVARSYLESVADMRAMVDEAARSARRAIVIAPNLASGYSALGWAMHYQLDFGNALKQLELSYRLGRGDARTVRIYATYLLLIGRTDQALKHAAESDALDPLHPRHQQMVAQIHFAAQRYEAAAAASRRTLQLAPTRLEPLYILATSLVMLGRTQEAQAAIAKLPHGNVRRLTIEAILYSRIGDKVSADRAIGQIERHGDLANFELAQVHAQRGRNEEALALLDGAWRNRDPDMTRVATDPLFAPLRGDAKFQALIKRLRLPA
jgi:serine/threonine-protein kinase